MKPTLLRLTVALLGAGLLLAGCANRPARPGPGAAGQPQASPEARPAPSTPAGERHREDRTARGSRAAPAGARQPGQPGDSTGIAACDDYLASYVACHRAAAIYKPEELQGRYEAMRTSLLRDSKDPAIRPNLATRCNSLASQLRQALHGKSCESLPAPSSSAD